MHEQSAAFTFIPTVERMFSYETIIQLYFRVSSKTDNPLPVQLA